MINFLVIIFILLLTLAVYFRTIFYGLIVDDIRHAVGVQKGHFEFHRKSFIARWLTFLRRRLYGYGTFAKKQICKFCEGTKKLKVYEDKKENWKEIPCQHCGARGHVAVSDTRYERLFTLFLHSLTCILMYYALGKSAIAFSAALLYCVNPVDLSTAVWFNGRRYSVVNILTLLYVLALHTPAGLIFYFLTPIFQGTALLLPLISGQWWQVAMLPLLIFLNWGRFRRFYFERRKILISDDWLHFTPRRVIIIVKTFGFYFSQMIVPGRTFMIYPFLQDWGLTKEGNRRAYRIDYLFIVGIIGIFGLIAAYIYYGLLGQGDRFVGYAALFVLLATLQWCNIVPLTQVVADRYVCTVNIFMSYLVVFFLHALLGDAGWPVVAGLFGYYLANTLSTLIMFKDIAVFYDYHNFHHPQNIVARKLKANWLLKAKDIMGAWMCIRDGLKHNKDDFTLNYLAGVCMQMSGDHQMSEHYFDVAEANYYFNQRVLWQDNIKSLRDNNRELAALPGHVNKYGRMGGISDVEL